MNNSIPESALLEIGMLWEKKGIRRVYLTDLPRRLGMIFIMSRNGRVDYAEIKGRTIHPAKARKILICLNAGGIYYDLVACKWCTTGPVDKLAPQIIRSVEKELSCTSIL